MERETKMYKAVPRACNWAVLALLVLMGASLGFAQVSGVPIPAPAPGGPAYIFYGGVNPAAAPNSPVLLFVHGLGANGTYWFTAGNQMYADVYNAGWRSAYISFNPDNSNNHSSIGDNAASLQQMLPTILAHFNAQQVYLVCHSKGGLDSQVAMEDTTFRSAIKGVIDIATPNQGTALADWAFGKGIVIARLFGFLSAGLYDLRPENVLSLRTTLDPLFASAGIPFYTLSGTDFSQGSIVYHVTGPILENLTGGEENDGFVSVSETQLPDTYAMNLGSVATDHGLIANGQYSWNFIHGRIQGNEDRQAGWHQIASGGFGDDANAWIWSQTWFQGKLYIGTASSVNCITDYMAALGYNLPIYPPPGNDCPTDPTGLGRPAEIWQYTPQTHTWLKVYTSPQDIPIGTDANGNPAFAARAVGYRSMTVYTETDGTQALYIGGVTGIGMFSFLPQYANNQYPEPIILRTTDGANFTEVPHDDGTFMGNLVINNTDIQVASFRSIVQYNGQMWVAATNFRGQGFIIASPNPSQGNNSFQRVSPSPALDTLTVWVLAAYNNALYVGTGDRTDLVGFGVYKTTNAPGDPVPYTYTPIITNGGGQTDTTLLSPTALTMHVWAAPDGVSRLYIGTDRKIEIERVNPDDSWDVVMGEPRYDSDGNVLKAPLSGIRYYFDNDFNGHVWQMQDSNLGLHASTWDWSIVPNNISAINTAVTAEQGFDFYRSPDGIHFYVVSKNGMGDGYNMGGRSGNYNHFGLFWGTARSSGGTQEWQDNTVLDLNNDGRISQTDANIIQSAMGQAVTGFDARDVNGNGVIDPQDVQFLMSQCTFPNCSEVPPPGTYYTPPPAAFNGFVEARTLTDVGATASMSWPAQPGATRYHIFRYTAQSPGTILQNLNVQSPISQTVTVVFPTDSLSGVVNQYCPADIASEFWFCGMNDAIQNETTTTTGGLETTGFTTGAEEIAQTTSITYAEALPTNRQCLYFVKWEDANGNLSAASNITAAPSFASVPPMTP